MVAAALSIAIDQSRDAAMEELMRQREIQAMHAAGLESCIAQKMYVQNLQLQQQPGAQPMPLHVAHARAQNLIVDLLDGIDRAALSLRTGRYEHAAVVLDRLELEAERATEPDLSQPAEAGSDAGSVPDEEMPDPQVPRAAP